MSREWTIEPAFNASEEGGALEHAIKIHLEAQGHSLNWWRLCFNAILRARYGKGAGIMVSAGTGTSKVYPVKRRSEALYPLLETFDRFNLWPFLPAKLGNELNDMQRRKVQREIENETLQKVEARLDSIEVKKALSPFSEKLIALAVELDNATSIYEAKNEEDERLYDAAIALLNQIDVEERNGGFPLTG